MPTRKSTSRRIVHRVVHKKQTLLTRIKTFLTSRSVMASLTILILLFGIVAYQTLQNSGYSFLSKNSILEISGTLEDYIVANPVDIMAANAPISTGDPDADAIIAANIAKKDAAAKGKSEAEIKKAMEMAAKKAAEAAYKAAINAGRPVVRKDKDNKDVPVTASTVNQAVAADVAAAVILVNNTTQVVNGEVKYKPAATQVVDPSKKCTTNSNFSVNKGETMLGASDKVYVCGDNGWEPLKACGTDGQTQCQKSDVILDENPAGTVVLTVKPSYLAKTSGKNCYNNGVVVGNGSIYNDGGVQKRCDNGDPVTMQKSSTGAYYTASEAKKLIEDCVTNGGKWNEKNLICEAGDKVRADLEAKAKDYAQKQEFMAKEQADCYSKGGTWNLSTKTCFQKSQTPPTSPTEKSDGKSYTKDDCAEDLVNHPSGTYCALIPGGYGRYYVAEPPKANNSNIFSDKAKCNLNLPASQECTLLPGGVYGRVPKQKAVTETTPITAPAVNTNKVYNNDAAEKDCLDSIKGQESNYACVKVGDDGYRAIAKENTSNDTTTQTTSMDESPNKVIVANPNDCPNGANSARAVTGGYGQAYYECGAAVAQPEQTTTVKPKEAGSGCQIEGNSGCASGVCKFGIPKGSGYWGWYCAKSDGNLPSDSFWFSSSPTTTSTTQTTTGSNLSNNGFKYDMYNTRPVISVNDCDSEKEYIVSFDPPKCGPKTQQSLPPKRSAGEGCSSFGVFRDSSVCAANLSCEWNMGWYCVQKTQPSPDTAPTPEQSQQTEITKETCNGIWNETNNGCTQTYLTKCGDNWYDTAIDNAHCGSCGNSCTTGSVCIGGSCR